MYVPCLLNQLTNIDAMTHPLNLGITRIPSLLLFTNWLNHSLTYWLKKQNYVRKLQEYCLEKVFEEKWCNQHPYNLHVDWLIQNNQNIAILFLRELNVWSQEIITRISKTIERLTRVNVFCKFDWEDNTTSWSKSNIGWILRKENSLNSTVWNVRQCNCWNER